MPPYVQKIRALVQLSQCDDAARDGWLWLAPRTERAERPETILELLNSPRSVIPFIQPKDSAVLLLTRVSIEWVAIGAGVEPGLVFPPDHRVTREQRAEVCFANGRRMEGIIQWNAADEHSRLSDFLNGQEDFFVMKTRSGVILVNKQRVHETRVTEATPRPAHVFEPAV